MSIGSPDAIKSNGRGFYTIVWRRAGLLHNCVAPGRGSTQLCGTGPGFYTIVRRRAGLLHNCAATGRGLTRLCGARRCRVQCRQLCGAKLEEYTSVAAGWGFTRLWGARWRRIHDCVATGWASTRLWHQPAAQYMPKHMIPNMIGGCFNHHRDHVRDHVFGHVLSGGLCKASPPSCAKSWGSSLGQCFFALTR